MPFVHTMEGFAYGLFMQVIPLRPESLSGGERVYSVHAYFRATRSNGFKSVYQRCMYAAAFGSSDEASREVGLAISAGCVCYSVGGCVCVSGE